MYQNFIEFQSIVANHVSCVSWFNVYVLVATRVVVVNMGLSEN